MELFLTLVSGIAWCIVYEECIRLGFKQKTYAMPFWALAANITWEGLYAILDLSVSVQVQAVVNLIWFLLDFVILWTYLKYGRQEWPAQRPAWGFYAWAVGGIAAMLLVQLAFLAEFGTAGHRAAQYAAFLQNLLMSVAFLHMLRDRKSAKGQSILLAVSKWLGTLAPTILMGVLSRNDVVLACGLLCTVYDVLYIVLLARCVRAERGTEKKRNL